MPHDPIPAEAVPTGDIVVVRQLIVALDARRGRAAAGRFIPNIRSGAWIWRQRSSRCRRSIARPSSCVISRNSRSARSPTNCCSLARRSAVVSSGGVRWCRHTSSTDANVGYIGMRPVVSSAPRRDGTMRRARSISVNLGAASRTPGEVAPVHRVRNAGGLVSESSRMGSFTGSACAIARFGMLDANDARGIQRR